MIDEGTLRKKARQALQTGKLPNRHPICMWGGNGCGASCPICDDPVKPDEVEYEVEFDEIDGSAGPQGYHIHVRCYAAWELERQILVGQMGQSATTPARANSNASGNGTSGGNLLSADSDGGTIPHRERHPGRREAT
jgi:hypothetical protein